MSLYRPDHAPVCVTMQIVSYCERTSGVKHAHCELKAKNRLVLTLSIIIALPACIGTST